ncbi:MAG: MgtC/SapB family protein [Candidatus Gracilibacteria bacterium]|jgi:uncharacterized membrane protein (DUF4010 family)|nr:MgtC/SapB family protein [Candidatus Gracilibacteria bacterium]
MNLSFITEILTAILLSGLVGLEREKKSQAENKGYFAGFRSFILIGLIGYLSFKTGQYSTYISVLLAGVVLALIAISYFVTAKNFNQIGITSELSGILVFVIGYLSASGETILATLIALTLVALLHFKTDLHNIAKKIKDIELISTLEFVFIAFIVLRILPNQNFGPFDFFNPFFIWLMVVFISAISFASYIAIKIFGTKKGITLTGLLSGFISSTALTLAFAEQSKKNKNIINPYVLAIIIAQSGMLLRVFIEVGVLNKEILPSLLIPFLTMLFVGVFFCVYYNRKTKQNLEESLNETEVELKNPFDLWPAIKFAAIFSGILLLGKIANLYFGDRGLFALSFITGIFDVDAITISLANFSKTSLSTEIATKGIMIAVFTNTISKAVLFMLLGNKKTGKRILFAFTMMIIFSGISLLLV